MGSWSDDMMNAGGSSFETLDRGEIRLRSRAAPSWPPGQSVGLSYGWHPTYEATRPGDSGFPFPLTRSYGPDHATMASGRPGPAGSPTHWQSFQPSPRPPAMFAPLLVPHSATLFGIVSHSGCSEAFARIQAMAS